MIETVFENMNDINAQLVTVIMPHPVRIGEVIEFDNASWTVHSVTWTITTNPSNYTRTVELHVRIK